MGSRSLAVGGGSSPPPPLPADVQSSGGGGNDTTSGPGTQHPGDERNTSGGHEMFTPIEVLAARSSWVDDWQKKGAGERDSGCSRPNCGQRRCSQNTHRREGTRSGIYEWKQREMRTQMVASVEVMMWVGSMMREWPHRVLPVVGLDEEVMVQKQWRRWPDPFIEGSRQVRETCCWTAWRLWGSWSLPLS